MPRHINSLAHTHTRAHTMHDVIFPAGTQLTPLSSWLRLANIRCFFHTGRWGEREREGGKREYLRLFVHMPGEVMFDVCVCVCVCVCVRICEGDSGWGVCLCQHNQHGSRGERKWRMSEHMRVVPVRLLCVSFPSICVNFALQRSQVWVSTLYQRPPCG